MNGRKKLTYISLFSGGGIGCYGFKNQGFECVATVEIIKRRLEIQKINEKCKYDSGYICDSVSKNETKEKILKELNFWKLNHNVDNLDVLIATPPCQGMSTANSKKNDNDIIRNSLVVDSVDLVDKLLPNFFIFENVPAFMKTTCVTSDDEKYLIGEYIYKRLSRNYSIFHKVINFKDYGVPSSRKRCLVIGVKNNLRKFISPLEIFPDFSLKQKTIRECIFDLKRLEKMGEIDHNDIFHFFRNYDPKMRDWISGIKEGQSAYENKDVKKIPHTVLKNGEIKINQNKMGGKYKRQIWDSVAPCIHTRNDQLASQNTIHPEDDRVFSIRELMIFMTVNKNFRWCELDEKELNSLPLHEKEKFLKKNEINIRQILGEAVPTFIFESVAKKIKFFFESLNIHEIDFNNLEKVEKENPKRLENGAFYTDKFIVHEIVKNLPNFDEKDEIRILEPSVGLGSFLHLLLKKYENKKKISIDVIDIDSNALDKLKKIFNKISKNDNRVKIKYINSDFLTFDESNKYDIVIGNPPFINISETQKEILNKKYKASKFGKNIITYFILKAFNISDYVCFVLPKNFLIAPNYNEIRNAIDGYRFHFILDFEDKGFSDVLLETIAFASYTTKYQKINNVIVNNIVNNKYELTPQNNITDKKFPNWIIYRDSTFDQIAKNMEFSVFNVYRDRAITNKYLTHDKTDIKVLRSRNVSFDSKIESIENYDKYLKSEYDISYFSISKFYNNSNVYLCPNFTTNIRVVKKPMNTLVNGSLAILELKDNYKDRKIDIKWFSSKEFIDFYKCSNNYQKNTINLDKNSIFYFGILNKQKEYS